MNTTTLLPRPLRLVRPWHQRLVDALRDAWRRQAALRRERADLEAASELSEVALRDMGAPEWLQAQARARRDAQRFERDLLRGGNPHRHD